MKQISKSTTHLPCMCHMKLRDLVRKTEHHVKNTEDFINLYVSNWIQMTS